jgi:hypothetical protein
MSGPDAAAYLGITGASFAKWVSEGRIPKPLPGTRRWDRKAIDLALDKLSDIVAPSIVPTSNLDAEEEWERKYEAREAAARTGGRN